jgi:hypothetical protein
MKSTISHKLRNSPSEPTEYSGRRTELLNDVDRSKVADNVAQPNAKGFGDSEQGVNRDRPFRPLYLADVNGVKVRFFGQFLLAESGLFTLQSNILADQTAVFWRTNHSPLPKQQVARRSHKLPALDCACSAKARSIETVMARRKERQYLRREEPDCMANCPSPENDRKLVASSE